MRAFVCSARLVDQPTRSVERASLNGAPSRDNAAVWALVSPGAFVERAGFIGDARYVCKRKMRVALIFFGRYRQTIEFSARFRVGRFGARVPENREKGRNRPRRD